MRIFLEAHLLFHYLIRFCWFDGLFYRIYLHFIKKMMLSGRIDLSFIKKRVNQAKTPRAWSIIEAKKTENAEKTVDQTTS